MIGIFILFILIFIYSPWLSFSGTLSSGDWPYIFYENAKEFSFIPQSESLWITYYYQPTAKLFVEYFNFSWEVAERILWFWPFLILSIVSSYYLTRSWLGVLLYTANTYILMVIGGGQMGVALAYSIAPFVLSRFISANFSTFTYKQLLFTGLILSIQLMFDPRITYITLFAVFIYYLLNFKKLIKCISYSIFSLILPIFIALILNSIWIIPLILQGAPSELVGYDSIAGFEYLSFARFEHVFSLLHPNWPENIFGKVYFMKAEFLVLPILAYSSLFFIKNSKFQILNSKQIQSYNSKTQNSLTIIYFAFLGLLGAFLAKGVNEPFGEVNVWLYSIVPGFQMFRDSTKFYILVALSYSVLTPSTIASVNDWLMLNVKDKIFNISYAFLIFTILYLIFLIHPAILHNLGGTFKLRVVPNEYIELKNYLYNDLQSYKVLWIPERQRFGFSNKTHPAIDGEKLYKTTDQKDLIEAFKKQEREELINLSIKYVIIPYDSEKEIFIKDRKYSESLYKNAISELRRIDYLKEVTGFGNITVFEVI